MHICLIGDLCHLLAFNVVFFVDWLQYSANSMPTCVLSLQSIQKAAEISFLRHRLPLAHSPGKDILSLQLSWSMKVREKPPWCSLPFLSLSSPLL